VAIALSVFHFSSDGPVDAGKKDIVLKGGDVLEISSAVIELYRELVKFTASSGSLEKQNP
jgi:hypothetical protein